MDESAVYNESDLAPFRRRLNDLHTIINGDSDSGKHPNPMTKLLERQLSDCGSSDCLMSYGHLLTTLSIFVESVLRRLQENLAVLSPELVPLHERLVTIRRKLVTLAAKGDSCKAELKPLQEELRKIDSLSIMPSFSLKESEYSRSICARMHLLCFCLAAPFYAYQTGEHAVNV